MAQRYNPQTGRMEGDIMPMDTNYQLADPFSVMGGFDDPAPVQMPGSIPGYQAAPNPGNIYPETSPTPQYNTIDPRRALWAGTLMDIGAYIASPFNYQFQGLGQKYMMQAEASNRQIQQQRNQDEIGKQRIAQNRRILDRQFNPYAEFPAAEQGFRAFADSNGLDQGSLETRQKYADYLRSTGVGSGGVIPAKIQQAEYLSNALYGKPIDQLGEEQAREVWSRANQAFDPREQYMYGNFDPYGYGNRDSYGREVGQLSAQQQASIYQSIGAGQAGLRSLYRLRDRVREGVETGRVDQLQAVWSAEAQGLAALMKDELFSKVAALRASGVTFGAMTEGEWRNLEKTVASIQNQPGANLQIIEDAIIKLETELAYAQGRMSRYQPGQLTPPNMDPSRTRGYGSTADGVEYLGDE